MRTRLQSDVLVGVAEAAGGTYRQLPDGADGLDRLYVEQIAGKPRRELAAADPELAARYQVFLLLAVLLLVLDLALQRTGRDPAADGLAASLAPLPSPRALAGLLVLLPILGADQAERAVRQGNALYQAGQYQAALERYREAAGSSPSCPRSGSTRVLLCSRTAIRTRRSTTISRRSPPPTRSSPAAPATTSG